ncbi:MAG: DUF4255 domain-containing protein [Methylobacter sp.]|jgi:hypothetical protein|uniref:DUF4255 domain-containing protein n=1 Tax=Methylobacter sp. TaxID=2051955 RepID=UPI0025F0D16D|nr:DUF4255 domain-containing protein [Methylobacter sp.]MCK9621352.1 DUF4255 domain-containing protein [Methylobacter sp.]
MFTALRATSLTLANSIRVRLASDPILALLFNPASAGNMVVSLNTPKELTERNIEGVSVWLYRVIRDAERLNTPPMRRDFNQIESTPLPVCLHYLITPIVNTTNAVVDPGTEQVILGKILQIFHDHPTLRGSDLQDDFEGTEVELNVCLESLNLEEITRVWDALEGSYQLSVSYEVGVVNVDSAMEPERVSPVIVVMPESGVIVSSTP